MAQHTPFHGLSAVHLPAARLSADRQKNDDNRPTDDYHHLYNNFPAARPVGFRRPHRGRIQPVRASDTAGDTPRLSHRADGSALARSQMERQSRPDARFHVRDDGSAARHGIYPQHAGTRHMDGDFQLYVRHYVFQCLPAVRNSRYRRRQLIASILSIGFTARRAVSASTSTAGHSYLRVLYIFSSVFIFM